MKHYPRRLPRLLIAVLSLVLLYAVLTHLPAGEDGDPPTYKAEILHVESAAGGTTSFAPDSAAYEVRIRLDSGPAEGTEETILHHTFNNPAFDIHPEEGEHILVRPAGESYAIVDYDRLPAMLLLLAIFAALLIFFGGITGAKALLVLLFAVILIAKGLISFILYAPSHIILATLCIGSIITLATQLIISGRNVKAAGAIIGTIGGILVAGILAVIAIHGTYLTGIAEEQAVMDVAVSIASAQYEMKQLAPKTKFDALVSSGMSVGRDVMGTMANTLVLAYIGGALPLILLISAQPDLPLRHVLNLNMIATEIVRSLVGSIGLLCAIPITAYVTALLITIRPRRKKRAEA